MTEIIGEYVYRREESVYTTILHKIEAVKKQIQYCTTLEAETPEQYKRELKSSKIELERQLGSLIAQAKRDIPEEYCLEGK